MVKGHYILVQDTYYLEHRNYQINLIKIPDFFKRL